MSILLLRTLAKVADKFLGDDDEDKKDRKGLRDRMNPPMFGSGKQASMMDAALNLKDYVGVSGKHDTREVSGDETMNEQEAGQIEGLFDRLLNKRIDRAENKASRLSGRAAGRANGRGRHADVPLTDEKGVRRSLAAIKADAGVLEEERLDTGRIFTAANGKGQMRGATCVRKGFEIKMGFGTAALAVTAGAVGAFPLAQPVETFELQNLYIAHNGDGASAAATIAIHYTLLAHLAVAVLKVGDDVLITGSNYVPVHGFCGPEELAGFVTSYAEPITLNVFDGAAYNANLISGVGGEGVSKV